MPMYAVIGFDHPPHSMALRDSIRPEHRAYVKGHDQKLRLASVMLDAEGKQKGTILYFEADSIDEVRAWTAAEPFCQIGVYRDLHIVEVRTAYNKIPLISWSV